MQVLIKHSADVNARDKNWQTPLHVAAANKAVKCAEVIIPLLSSVNVSDRGGRTALHHAALNGHVEVSALITGAKHSPYRLSGPQVEARLTLRLSESMMLPSTHPTLGSDS